jgi:hypothetical protein
VSNRTPVPQDSVNLCARCSGGLPYPGGGLTGCTRISAMGKGGDQVDRSKAPAVMRILGLLLTTCAVLSMLGQAVEQNADMDAFLVAAIFGVSGYALFRKRRWGYVLVAVLAIGLLLGASYLLLVEREEYWAVPIALWVFLAPGLLILLVLLLPPSIRWFRRTDVEDRPADSSR